MRAPDLTMKEQRAVQGALNFLRVRCGGWAAVSKVLHVKDTSLSKIAKQGPVTPTLAFRVARFVQVGIDDLLAGKFPSPGTCPMCGHQREEDADVG